jgi:hypothetical protein
LGVLPDDLRGSGNPRPSRLELCSHYERALRTIIADPTKAAEIAQSALIMGKD